MIRIITKAFTALTAVTFALTLSAGIAAARPAEPPKPWSAPGFPDRVTVTVPKPWISTGFPIRSSDKCWCAPGFPIR